MKKIYYGMLTALFSTLVLAAEVIIRPQCVTFWYQPELPKSLRK